MLLNGEIKEKGVFAPEGIVDPTAFFKKLTEEIPVEESKTEPIFV
jgi:saccharopine dehydrogenase-like NADP-dependent oxidoreductase